VADDVERLTSEALGRKISRGTEAVERLEKLAGPRSKHRAKATEALRRIVLEGKAEHARFRANMALVSVAEPGDEEAAAFFREHLNEPEHCFHAVRGLLKTEGRKAYPDVVAVAADPKHTMEDRGEAVRSLAKHAKQPFARRLRKDFHEWQENDLLLREVKAWAKAGFPEASPKDMGEFKAALEKLGIKVPADYLRLLESYEEAEYTDRFSTWRLASDTELLETVSVDKHKGPYLRQLVGYAKTLASVFGSDAVEDQKGKPYPLDRLQQGIAIADDGSGDVLFLDPLDNFSVWIFHHDGGDVHRVAADFGTWLGKAKKE